MHSLSVRQAGTQTNDNRVPFYVVTFKSSQFLCVCVCPTQLNRFLNRWHSFLSIEFTLCLSYEFSRSPPIQSITLNLLSQYSLSFVCVCVVVSSKHRQCCLLMMTTKKICALLSVLNWMHSHVLMHAQICRVWLIDSSAPR